MSFSFCLKASIFWFLLLSISHVNAQSSKEPRFVDHPLDMRPIKFGWNAKSPLDREGTSLALKGGITYTNINGSPQINAVNGDDFANSKKSWTLGYTLGFLAEIPFAEDFYIEPELDFTRAGTKISDATNSGILHLSYFNIPLLLKYKPLEGLGLFAGPQVDYLFAGTFQTNSAGSKIIVNEKGNFKTLGFSFSAGLGYGFGQGLGLDIRYNQSLQSINKTAVNSASNAIVSFSLRYFFFDLD